MAICERRLVRNSPAERRAWFHVFLEEKWFEPSLWKGVEVNCAEEKHRNYSIDVPQSQQLERLLKNLEARNEKQNSSQVMKVKTHTMPLKHHRGKRCKWDPMVAQEPNSAHPCSVPPGFYAYRTQGSQEVDKVSRGYEVPATNIFL